MESMVFSIQEQVLKAIGWTLLHSFWQAFALLMILYMIRSAKNNTAVFNYKTSVVSLFSLIGMNIVTFLYYFLSYQKHSEAAGFIKPIVVDSGNILHGPISDLESGQVTFRGILEHNMDLILYGWILGILFFSVRFFFNLGYLYRLRTVKIDVPDEYWLDRIRKISERIGLKRKVGLLKSGLLSFPATFGYFKPVILIPASLFAELSAYELEAILLHEMAHIKRNDYLINIFQSLVETLLFFNPFVWWMSAIIKKERENCCDDFVVERFDSLSYVTALAKVEEFRLGSEELTMAATGGKNQLLNRIKRIMEKNAKRRNNWNKVSVGVILLAVVLCISWISPKKKLQERKAEFLSLVQDLEEEVMEIKNEISGNSAESDEEEAVSEESEEVSEERLEEELDREMNFTEEKDTTKKDSLSAELAAKLEKELADLNKLLESEEFRLMLKKNSLNGMTDAMRVLEETMVKTEQSLEEMEVQMERQFGPGSDFDFRMGPKGSMFFFNDSGKNTFVVPPLPSLPPINGKNGVFVMPPNVNWNMDSNFNFDFDFDFDSLTNGKFNFYFEDDNDNGVLFFNGNDNGYQYHIDPDWTEEEREEYRERMREAREEYREHMEDYREDMREWREDLREREREVRQLQREKAEMYRDLSRERARAEEDYWTVKNSRTDAVLVTKKGGDAIHLRDLEDMMREDGLLKSRTKYKLTYDKKEMKVNGKEVSKSDFKKYKNLLGNAEIAINKSNGNYSITIND